MYFSCNKKKDFFSKTKKFINFEFTATKRKTFFLKPKNSLILNLTTNQRLINANDNKTGYFSSGGNPIKNLYKEFLISI